VEGAVCVVMSVGRATRSWIHADGVILREKAPK
jgi:hypothetical protein